MINVKFLSNRGNIRKGASTRQMLEMIKNLDVKQKRIVKAHSSLLSRTSQGIYIIPDLFNRDALRFKL